MKKGLGTFSFEWIVFFLFVITNALIAFGCFPLWLDFSLGLGGIVLPFLFLFFLPSPEPSGIRPSVNRDFLPDIPFWAWGGVILLGFILRFAGLTAFSVWPHFDEGLVSHFAMGLTRHWDWGQFHGTNQMLPLYLWGEAFCFKLMGASLFSLWFFPAILSCLTILVGALAARAFFPRSQAFLMTALLAFGFWPIFIGRFSMMTVLLVLAEFTTLYLLGLVSIAQPSQLKVRSILLGVGLGLGFYTFVSWPVVAILVGASFLTLLFTRFRSEHPSEKIAYFFCPFILMITPFIWAALTKGYGHYAFNLLANNQAHPLVEQGKISFSYIACIFWGIDQSFFTYQPVWGGYLNPLLGALFFLGVREIFRDRRHGIHRWLVIGFILFLLQGLMTRERETFRIAPLIPVLLVLVVLGWNRLMRITSPQRTLIATVLLLVLSLGFDLQHLSVYHHLWDSQDTWKGYAKSHERYEANQILETTALQKGPGLVFSNFVPGLSDLTLDVADDSYNALNNPSLSADKAQWAAVLINANYKPFLDKRFGSAKAYALSKESVAPDGGWMLWVFPLTSGNRAVVDRWVKADQALKPFIESNLGQLHGESYEKTINALTTAEPTFQGDPFLQSVYWEKMGDLILKQSVLVSARPDPTLLDQAIHCLDQAVSLGYPSANLYNHLGNLWLLRQNEPAARKAFQNACRAPVDLTDSLDRLKSLP
jgi:4-amino-4-deoxy-L-arabinose transferase-like glycosyltransferase